ncbi:MAG: ParB/RepB/Spo0J family partition protein [Clostridiales bacterium]|nr:ParB/RepB/Spo0J family partition protein [Clostridiales bacterium]MDY5677314.1 ParB/RepB/Spo0J family partition protein [Eubacteriales bacterium]MDY5726006.1 ParB/RepB/Spo0J family partition protein [Eubacteriales bacterium]
MAAQRKGLGRGLSALLGMNDMGDDVLSTPVAPGLNTEPQQEQPREEFVDVGLTTEDVTGVADMDFAPAEPTEEEQPQEKIVAVNIAVSDIDPNYEQPRKNFDEAALNELAESIRQHGVIQPIVVVRMGMRFMIISGERRWRASKLANKTTIPAIIKDYTPQQIKEIAIIENLQREDLNPVEAARAIKQLMEEFNMTQEMAADRIGKSRSAIANTLRLLTLDEKVLDLIAKGELSAGHGRALVVIENKNDQVAIAQKAHDSQMSVRELEKKVKDYLNPKKDEKELARKKEVCLELKDLVVNMQRAFATKVTAVGNNKKGRICIDYFSGDDLDRICAMIRDWQANLPTA